MENPSLTLKIELLGQLLEELNYLGNEPEEIEFIDEEFDDVLAAATELKGVVLDELEEYFNHAKRNNEPIYLPYKIIQRDLRNAKF
jgi:hypothetical protein